MANHLVGGIKLKNLLVTLKKIANGSRFKGETIKDLEENTGGRFLHICLGNDSCGSNTKNKGNKSKNIYIGGTN